MARITIIEDDESLRDECARLLSLSGFEAVACTDFAHAADEALESGADLCLVDLALPGSDGLAICRGIRERSQVPLIVLTSSDREFDEVMSMRVGADDFLTKPYSPAVLVARIERALERAGSARSARIAFRGLAFDPSDSTASFGGARTELPRNEARILESLIRAGGAIVSRQSLMYDLWQTDDFIDDNTLTVNVTRLRRSLASIGVPEGFVRTHRGQGYSL